MVFTFRFEMFMAIAIEIRHLHWNHSKYEREIERKMQEMCNECVSVRNLRRIDFVCYTQFFVHQSLYRSVYMTSKALNGMGQKKKNQKKFTAKERTKDYLRHKLNCSTLHLSVSHLTKNY